MLTISSRHRVLLTLAILGGLAVGASFAPSVDAQQPVTVSGLITPSDNFANPANAITVYALTGCWDGATWDRCAAASSDTEMATALALAENVANPTTAPVGSFNMVWDGATWDRLPGTSALGLTANTELPPAAAITDDFANPTTSGVMSYTMMWDGSGWDRWSAVVSAAQLGTWSVRLQDAAGTGYTSSTQGANVAYPIVVIDPVTDLPAVLDTGGGVGFPYSSVGTTEDEHAVSATPVTLEAIIVTNTNVAWRYLRCENDTAANTVPGTDTPEFEMGIPPSGGFAYSFGKSGRLFSIALTCWITTGAAVSDVAEVAADEIFLDYVVKP